MGASPPRETVSITGMSHKDSFLVTTYSHYTAPLFSFSFLSPFITPHCFYLFSSLLHTNISIKKYSKDYHLFPWAEEGNKLLNANDKRVVGGGRNNKKNKHFEEKILSNQARG